MKKVLLINGSPHKAGCTFTALEEIARQLEKDGVASEIVHIGDGPHYGCIGCGACRKTGHCFRNDIVCQLQEKMAQCDGMIVGSPVHYASAAGALCTVLDRLFYSSAASFDGKPGDVYKRQISCWAATRRRPWPPRRRSTSCSFSSSS